MSALYATLRRSRYLNIVAINLRFLIGLGFIPSGMKKILGTPFAKPGNTGPFFEYLDALYQTGFYYNMIGWVQVIAAVLLITQRFATVGAFIFLPIIFNITALTWSTSGSRTPFLATMMLSGIVFLLLWDYYKWINIFSGDNKLVKVPAKNDYPSYNSVWIMTGVGLLLIPSILLALAEVFNSTANGHSSFSLIASSIALSAVVLIPVIGFTIDEMKYRRSRKIAATGRELLAS